MDQVLRPPSFLRTTWLLLGREAGSKLGSPWVYGVATIVCLFAWIFGAGFLQAFETETVLVTNDPLMPLNVLVVIFLALVLGVRLATSLAWEREHRTLEVLLVGPVSPDAVLLAKFLAEVLVLACLFGVYVLYLMAAQPIGYGVIDLATVRSAGTMPVHALPLMAFALLVSAGARTVRGAVVAYLSAVLVLAGFDAGVGILRSIPPEDLSLAATYLRAGLETAAGLVDPVSPTARLAELVVAWRAQVPIQPGQALHAAGLSAAFLVAGAVLNRLRGAVS